ncbi:MAG: glycoside hydrolase [Candidatus Nitrosocosmicus sp.]|nr:glycoside hydrolase [Candidatus Nitrosocosmicus sp.]
MKIVLPKETFFITFKFIYVFPILVSTLSLLILGFGYDYELAQAQVQVQGKIEITRNTTIQNATDPGLAINSDSSNIYAVFHRASNDSTNLYMVNSDNNGSSFSSPVRVNDKEGDAEPNVSPPIRFGPNNEIFVLWHNSVPSESIPWGIPDIRLAKSVDGGKTFGPTISPAKNEPVSERGWADLAISKNGTILIPYVNNELVALNESTLLYSTDKIDLLTQIDILRSADGGDTFQKITLDKEGCQCCDTQTTHGPNGEIYIAYRDSDRDDAQLSDYSDPYIRNNSESITPVKAKAIEQGLIETKIYSTTRDMVISHTVDNGSGLKYSEPVPVQDLEWIMNGCPSVGAGFQFDSEGTLHVGYFTGNGTDGAGYYYVKSIDNGKTFGEPVPVYTSNFVPTTHTNMDLTVDKNGNIWMAFVTYPVTTNNGEGASHGEDGKVLNVVVLDKSGNKLGQTSFTSKDISNPSMIPVLDGAMVGFSDGNDNVNMITMKRT